MLRTNQINAINSSVNNDFDSGVHFHATGTGKSWVGLELISKYNEVYPNRNILWVCEQKSILIEQFNKTTLKEKGYSNINSKFLVINYTENKPGNWYSSISSATIWGKPILLIINRAFLVSGQKYSKMSIKFSLIIHDECHSITNKTTQEFYKYYLENYKETSCIGFSATPCLDYEPYNKVLTDYTIYDAFCDDVIVAPKICWVKCDKRMTDKDFITICKNKINNLYYKKIIVWCGTIDKCYELSKLWRQKFDNFYIGIDTSKDSNESYSEYADKNSNAILFCAGKHREGSDIKNLDCCIFLDKVQKRNPKTFVQCIGRVLRKDKESNKKYGLILDLKAGSCIKICDRMNQYLNASINFPWNYKYQHGKIGKKQLILHELTLIKNVPEHKNVLKEYDIEDIQDRFVKECPDDKVYIERLNRELELIEDKGLSNYLIRATEILRMTNYIPHVTRGSCGSSLVCYLLGISNVDPVKTNISFARFLNQYRNNLPDIDFDFPHYLRDEVFLKLELNWPNQVARISNHVHWHEKSALREAIRMVGINKRIAKEDIHNFVKSLSKEKRELIHKYKKELEDTFRHYSLHCGGIVFFHDGIPEELIINRKTLSQILYDKNEISKTKQFKIDILSSKGISQLIDISGKNIDFNDCPYDEKTYKLLQDGDNIGITLAESPLMRKAMMKIKPKSIDDIALCLAIIRPAAKDARYKNNEIDYSTEFVYDDDAISLLSNTLDIDEELADKYRRCLSKNKWKIEDRKRFNKSLYSIDENKRKVLLSKLSNLRKYSFCKSHSYSYAQLVYKIAYQKANNSNMFWISTLKNASSSYRKWVHLYEAFRAGVDINTIINKKRECSVYAENRRKKFNNLTQVEQLTRYGYWDMKPGEFFPGCYFYKKDEGYYFGGLIASLRVLDWKKRTIVSSVGVGPGKYIELTTTGVFYNSKYYGVKGRAILTNKNEKTYKAYIAKYY
ncbi:DEAD/DEAH box helicase family protein [bacterium]|nr:DEAD/DEAH box helicase family protein [bacterium]